MKTRYYTFGAFCLMVAVYVSVIALSYFLSFWGGFMTTYQIIRIFEALIMAIIGLICVGFIHATLAGVLCFIASALYLNLSFNGGE